MKLNTTFSHILSKEGAKSGFPYPNTKGKQPDRTKESKKYCAYHQYYGHTTDSCYHLRNVIQIFIDEGKFMEYVQLQPTETEDIPKKRVEFPQDGKYINMITFSNGGQEEMLEDILELARNRKKVETHEVFKLSGPPSSTWEDWMPTPLTFSTKDVNQEVDMHNNPLVITLPIHGWNVTKVLVDIGSSLNVLFYEP
ncbi:uncharacterized protein LOC113353106 [Papaver somniferum]|uniref:uncharacterized protein LOC113353106 n=1 Tax=Papaver somniferum TaxID=3469 RepID=UPI000E6FEB0B|nr:uncharacterized protein LOC113353106 [Papaver somniferum]